MIQAFDSLRAPGLPVNLRPSDIPRFLASINKDGPTVRPELGPCWLWTGATRPKGYGVLGICNGRKRKFLFTAHRLSFLLHTGFLPPDKLICHHCDTPLCVNPDHLFPGSNRDNHDDMVRKGRKPITPSGDLSFSRLHPERLNPLRGIKHPFAKLSDSNVRHIRELHAEGSSFASLARAFRVDWTTVRSIVKRQTWTHI